VTRLVCDVDIAYPGFTLDVDCALPLDGTTALFGASGSGKSTLLRIISGLEKRARGAVRYGDEVWQDGNGRRVPPHRRGIGYVFQDARLFAHLSVAGNLRYSARRAGNGCAIQFDDVVDALDLSPLLGRRTDQLSGGERQRVALGRALLARPRLMLMDEPLASLDEKRKADILPYIERLPAVFRVPTIYVTHNIAEVTRLADRMLVLSDGRVAAEGAIADVLARLDLAPETGRFEAGSLLNATVIGHDDAYQLSILDHAGQQIEAPRADLAIGAHVRLRVRARDVMLATQRPSGISARNVLRGTIREIAEEPDTAYAETLVDIGGASLRSRITRKTVAELGLAAGAPVYAIVKAVTFDRKSLSRTGAVSGTPRS
jgi:molybdate transport system ATP-binding protein